jgi:VRR-NUC domain
VKRRRGQPEAAIARAIEQHYRLRAAPGVFMFAVPNGGLRSKIEAAIMQGLGVRAGVPDTFWIKDGRTYALELKAEGGRLSPAQEQTLIALREAGAMATHAHGLEQALRVLEGWGLLRGRAS